MNVRHDSYIQLVIEFIQTSILNWEKNNKHLIDETSIEKYIRTYLTDKLPNIMENGLGETSSSNAGVTNPLVFEDIQQMWGKPLLPLLIYLFLNSRDFGLNNLILKLIFKCFK